MELQEWYNEKKNMFTSAERKEFTGFGQWKTNIICIMRIAFMAIYRGVWGGFLFYENIK